MPLSSFKFYLQWLLLLCTIIFFGYHIPQNLWLHALILGLLSSKLVNIFSQKVSSFYIERDVLLAKDTLKKIKINKLPSPFSILSKFSFCELIPFSSLFTNKKVDMCHQKGFLFELITLIITGVHFIYFSTESPHFYINYAFVLGLLIISFSDIQFNIVEDDLLYIMLWSGLLVNIHNVHTSLQFAVIGACTGYLVFWIFNYCIKLFTKTNGVGYGDMKTFAVIGAWLGLKSLLIVIYASIFLSFIALITTIMRKNKAFVPYIAIPSIIIIYCGNTIFGEWNFIEFYIGWIKNIIGLS